MTHTFKPGDRVKAYGHPGNGSFDASLEGDSGTVIGTFSDGYLEVKLDEDYSDSTLAFHPRQCVPLKPKRPRLRVWLTVNKNTGFLGGPYSKMPDRTQIDTDWEIVEFIEVRKKKA